jgi:hypothetical protein
MWNQIWGTVVAEFSDLHDVAEITRVCVRLLVAMVLGGLLGYERELRGTAAGLRTHMLVAVGAALFVLVPLQAGTQLADMSRVLQGVIAGIGFLGAGAIIKLGEQQGDRGDRHCRRHGARSHCHLEHGLCADHPGRHPQGGARQAFAAVGGSAPRRAAGRPIQADAMRGSARDSACPA